jgi:plasmid rolling circle replication initiator protein Rep
LPAALCLLDHTKADSPALENAVELPPSHEVWNLRKASADDVATLYDQAPVIGLRKYAPKVRTCSQSLTLTDVINQQTGEITYKAESWKCHQRHCPICQSARANKLQREFIAALPKIMEEVPQGVFLMLTLTVRNCPITELRPTLSEMGKAWKRLLRKPELRIIRGWIRGTEVTKGESGPMMAHPHYHVLLLVPPYYFSGKSYIKHARWVELWQDAARLNYPPAIDIRRVKTAQSGFAEAVKAATYSVKPSNLTDDPSWFHELHEQVSGLRFLATGGVIKAVLRESGQSDDLADTPEPDGEVARSRVFGWNRPIRRYRLRKEPT